MQRADQARQAALAYDRIVIFRDSINHPFFTILKKLLEAAAAEKGTTRESAELAAYLCNEDSLTLASILVTDENSFSRLCEQGEEIPLEISLIAKHDIELFMKILSFPVTQIAEEPLKPLFNLRFPEVDESPEELYDWLCAVWKERGCGMLHESHFLRWTTTDGFQPVRNFDKVRFEDLAGYDEYKEIIKTNCDMLAGGLKANNILLSGSKGCGKSSLIKAAGNAFASLGVKTVEIAKTEAGKIDQLFAEIAKRGQKFIIFIDDISFDENESAFREFKSALDGCASVKPDNAVIYATSNLRHMVSEKVSDGIEDIYSTDTRNERVSLSDRFGITLFFLQPDQNEYLAMAEKIALRRNITVTENFREEAIRWALSYKGRSGRSAEQFVTNYAGTNRQK